MKRIIFIIMVIFQIFAISCHTEDNKTDSKTENTDDIKQKSLLPAPQNFDVRYFNSQAGKNMTFSFYAVEKAKHYLIYYNTTSDTSTAKPFISGEYPPIKFVFSGTLPTVFWVRAFDDEEYGEWSNAASPRSSLY